MNSIIRLKSNWLVIVAAIVGLCIVLIAGVILITAFYEKPNKIFSPDRSLYIVVKESSDKFIIQEFKSQNNELYQSTEYRGKFGHVTWSNDSKNYAVSMDGVFSDINLVDVATGYIVDYDTIIGNVIIKQIEQQLSIIIDNQKRLAQHYEFVTWSKNDALICVYIELAEQAELRFSGYIWLDLQSSKIENLLLLK